MTAKATKHLTRGRLIGQGELDDFVIGPGPAAFYASWPESIDWLATHRSARDRRNGFEPIDSFAARRLFGPKIVDSLAPGGSVEIEFTVGPNRETKRAKVLRWDTRSAYSSLCQATRLRNWDDVDQARDTLREALERDARLKKGGADSEV